MKSKIFFKGQEIRRIIEYNPPCALSDMEMIEWNRLKSTPYMSKVFCSFVEFDCFLNQILFTGKVQYFIDLCKKVIKANPNANQFLLDSREISPLEIR